MVYLSLVEGLFISCILGIVGLKKQQKKQGKQRSREAEILEKQTSKEAGSRKAKKQGNRNPRKISKRKKKITLQKEPKKKIEKG